jgi:hypothetical protein
MPKMKAEALLLEARFFKHWPERIYNRKMEHRRCESKTIQPESFLVSGELLGSSEWEVGSGEWGVNGKWGVESRKWGVESGELEEGGRMRNEKCGMRNDLAGKTDGKIRRNEQVEVWNEK